MKLIVGLGNPGPEYQLTRHNVGFLLVDRLLDRWRASAPQYKNQGEVFQAAVGREKVLLVKPDTFMNLSGKCVAPLFNFLKIPPEDMIVLHDDLDLSPMQLRIKTGGGTGGHNGLKSIDECLGAGKNGYHRIRLGIGHPAKLGLRHDVADFVLSKFSQDECIELDRLFDRATAAIERMIAGDVRGAMTEFNRASPSEQKD